MPTFYNFRENGLDYSFDDVFVPADLFREGNLFTWGGNAYGQLGTNDTAGRNTPVTTLSGGTNWKQVSGSVYNNAAVKTDGTLWTWGHNSYGTLGTNDTTHRNTPVTTFAGGTNWKQVIVGGVGFHIAAIKTDGTLWVWGYNNNGQLGINDTTNRNTPVQIFAGGTNWKQVSGGSSHTAAIKTDGTLWVWGYNNNGKLGTNDTTNRLTPVTTFAGGTNWKQVSAGTFHCSTIKTDGTLWTWGGNAYGQLGINDTTNRNTPVQVFGNHTNWKQVASGYAHTAAIKTDGTLWTWGRGNLGQLGTNDGTARATPVTTFAGGTNWKQVSAEFYYNTAAIKTDGTLWAWGRTLNGTLGLGINSSTNRETPVTTFAGGTNWKQVSGGYGMIAVTYIDSVLL